MRHHRVLWKCNIKGANKEGNVKEDIFVGGLL